MGPRYTTIKGIDYEALWMPSLQVFEVRNGQIRITDEKLMHQIVKHCYPELRITYIDQHGNVMRR